VNRAESETEKEKSREAESAGEMVKKRKIDLTDDDFVYLWRWAGDRVNSGNLPSKPANSHNVSDMKTEVRKKGGIFDEEFWYYWKKEKKEGYDWY